MQFRVETSPRAVRAEATAVFVFGEKREELFKRSPLIPAEARPLAKALFESGFAGKIGEKKSVLLANGKRLLLIGFGKEELPLRRLPTILRTAVMLAKSERISSLAIALADFDRVKLDPKRLAEMLATNSLLANYEFTKYKKAPEGGFASVKSLTILTSKESHRDVEEGVRVGRIIGEMTNRARDLANVPGGDMTPKIFADVARNLAREVGVKITVLGPREIEREKMGGVLGVAKGSNEEPQFVILEYMNEGKEKPVVLVGKGVTFDTGGLNIKTAEGMYEMHMDMSGGAAAIHAIAAIAKLKLPTNVVALVPCVENMPSGSSYRPGDLLKSRSGKTIEVLNTDAEGRVILADALAYAEEYKPRVVVDIATLTGAAAVALGQRTSGLFTNRPDAISEFMNVGEQSGDLVWPLPLWEEYEEEVKGTFGDVANIGKTRYGGAIAGAMFLWQFAKNFPWIHLDIAPTMTSIEGLQLAKGAAGSGVRFSVELVRQLAKNPKLLGY